MSPFKKGCNHKENCRCFEAGPRITGILIPLILHSLRKNPTHGYQLIDRIKEDWFLQDFPAPTVIYRHLRNLEEMEIVSSTFEPGEGPARKVYTITDSGKAYLGKWLFGLKTLHEDLGTFIKMTH